MTFQQSLTATYHVPVILLSGCILELRHLANMTLDVLQKAVLKAEPTGKSTIVETQCSSV